MRCSNIRRTAKTRLCG